MAEHQVISCRNIHITFCYFSHHSYSRDFVSHPNGWVQRAASFASSHMKSESRSAGTGVRCNSKEPMPRHRGAFPFRS